MVAFLKALTDERVRQEMAPFDHPQLFVPNGHPGDNGALTCVNAGNACDSLLTIPAVGAGGRPAAGLLPLQPFLTGAKYTVAADFDKDGKSDISIWRPGDGNWYSIRSSDGAVTARQWGAPNDIPVPGDYDGDGKPDLAVWRPSDGNWYIINSSTGATDRDPVGRPAEMYPWPAILMGMAKRILPSGVRETATGISSIPPTGATTVTQWGTSGDVPVPGDYDGDGKRILRSGVRQRATGILSIPPTGTTTVTQWGTAERHSGARRL